MIDMAAVIAHFMVDTSGKRLRINTKEDPDKKFAYIGMEHVEKNTGKVFMQQISGKDILSQTVRVPYDYTIYFDVAWHDLIHLSPAGISPKMKTALEDHRKRLIYWGTVATDKILPLLSFGGEWDRIIKTCQLPEPLVDHEINFRIYKDALSIRNYIALSVNERKHALMEGKIK